LHSATILSSRAFPSHLIPHYDHPSRSSTPVLFPGVDSLNHRRGTKITWSVDSDPKVKRVEQIRESGNQDDDFPKDRLTIILDEQVAESKLLQP
jgi:hypothetical protein